MKFSNRELTRAFIFVFGTSLAWILIGAGVGSVAYFTHEDVVFTIAAVLVSLPLMLGSAILALRWFIKE